ncbi:MAG: cytochrome P460 family protein [Desulfovibrionaceae bacterium]
MPRPALVLAALALAGFMLHSAARSDPASPNRAQARKLWTHITRTEPFQHWPRLPETKAMRHGPSPHGPVRSIRFNPAARAVGPPYQPGSIIVMASYGGDGELKRVSLMYKAPGQNPGVDTGPAGWFWAMYGADGSIGPAGAPPGCIDCHRRAEKRDFVFVAKP